MSPISYRKYYVASLMAPELDAAMPSLALVAARAPLSEEGRQRLLEGAARHLCERASRFLQKVFVGELEAARRHENTGFEEFMSQIQEGAVRDGIRARHSFLIYRIGLAIQRFVSYFNEHVAHLINDFPALEEQGWARDELLSVAFGCGDPHRAARTTVCYQFGGIGLYYKPRNLHFDELFADIQRRVCPDVPTLRTLPREGYGWQLAVAVGRSEGEEAAATFYLALGHLTAIAHALLVSDIHYENIVTDDAGVPFFVDLEAMFSNPARRDRMRASDRGGNDAEAQFDESVAASLFSVGVVPFRRSKEGALAGAAQASQVSTPVSRETPVDAGTDRMRMVRVSTPVEIDSPVPSVEGRPASFEAHFGDFARGYRDCAEKLACHRDLVIELVSRASSWPSRQILRNTYVYSLFLAETTHPAYTSESATRSLLLKMRREEAVKPYLERVVDAEIEQMIGLDVPYFCAAPNETTLTFEGGEVPEFFDSPASELVTRRLADMATPGWVDGQLALAAQATGCSFPSASEASLHSAEAFDREVASRALLGRTDASVLWTISPPPDMPGMDYAIATMGPSLYSGYAGLLLYLIERAPEEERAEEMVRRVVWTGRRTLREQASDVSCGAYTGCEGLLLSLFVAGNRRGDHQLAQEALEGFLGCEARWSGECFDVMDGLAGHMLIALTMYQAAPERRLLSLIDRLGDRVARGAQETTAGVNWLMPSLRKAITGFAHGGSGIAYALYEAGVLLERSDLQGLALKALRHEDALFNEGVALWPDTRQENEHYALSWCNGSAGFLLARAGCWSVLEPWQRAQAVRAAERSVEWLDRSADDSLCHGTAGVRLALMRFAQATGVSLPELPVSQPGLSSSFRSGWSHEPSHLGLLVGKAGVVYAGLTSHVRDVCPLTIFPVVRAPSATEPSGRNDEAADLATSTAAAEVAR